MNRCPSVRSLIAFCVHHEFLTMKVVHSKIRFLHRRRAGCRRGVAAAEFAACLPVIVLLILAMIESCTMIFLKQSLTVATYEGARVAVGQNAEPAEVFQAARQILADRDVQGAKVDVRPRNFRAMPVGTPIEVTVEAPADANSIIPGSFYRGRTLSAAASMIKEF